MMLHQFYPTAYADSVFAIDYQALYNSGVRGLLFDIDNTLVHHGDDSTAEIDALFRRIQSIGLRPLILSNNTEERIQRFLQNIDASYVCDADKPRTAGYQKGLELLGLPASQAVVIGDQVFTDILGANRCGLDSILVRFLRLPEEKRIGKRRQLERLVLQCYRRSSGRDRKFDKMILKEGQAMRKRRNFCDINPFCYAISEKKEILRRHLKDLHNPARFAKEHSAEKLPVLVSSHSSQLIKTGKGIDPVLQENKAVNIRLASSKIHGLVIHPGESFSFWRTVGNATARKGYKPGRVLMFDKLMPGIGGGLCNLANTINLLVLHSPLTITEFHTHSDALAPDAGGRVPMSSGTSVSYNYIDYQFTNTTDQDFQLLVWCENGRSYGELRCCHDIPYSYALTEEDHHFHPEGKEY